MGLLKSVGDLASAVVSATTSSPGLEHGRERQYYVADFDGDDR